MDANLSLSFLGLLYIILLTIVFFNQKRIHKFENVVYSYLLLDVLFQLLFGIISYYSIIIMNPQSIFNVLANRCYLIFLAGWAMFFSLYVLSISINIDEIKTANKIKSVFVIIFFILSILFFILPLSFINENGTVYSKGLAADLAYVVAVVGIIVVIGCIIKNFKNLMNKKYIPTFIFMLLGTIFMIIQMRIPGLFLVSPLEVFITFLMYFTIENPDVKIIEELTKSRVAAEKSTDEKQQFIFLVTDQIRDAMDNVSVLTHDSLKQVQNENIKNNLLNIKQILESSRIRINEMLNISDVDVMNLKIVKNKYNINLLTDEIKLHNKNLMKPCVDFRVNIAENMPPVLYGDSLKLKQIINTLLRNSAKYTESGFIELRLEFLIKYNICRLIISVEDSGIGMDNLTINNILEDKTDLNNKDLEINETTELNLKIVKKIIQLSGGTLTIDSTLKKGTNIKFIMDQGIPGDAFLQKGISKYAEEMRKKTKFGLITTDAKILKAFKKMLNKCDFSYDIFEETKKCLDNVRDNINYDYIIIEENMPKIPAKDLYSKLKLIENFKGKVIVLSNTKNFVHKKELLDAGFFEVISVPLVKNDVEQKLERIKNQK